MYFKTSTPESVGISSKTILRFLKTLESYKLCTHDIIMAKGDKIFFESYWAPFTKDYRHRMYSVTKSFVAIAVLFAVDEGLLSLDDKFVKFFPEAEKWANDDILMEATIEDMLKMESSRHFGNDWFADKPEKRYINYFDCSKFDKIPGTLFAYDSSGSYMLGVIVERLTGMTFLDYLKKKALREIGFSEDSYCLKAPGGYSWGDSALLCTARDLLLFARFVMNKGSWGGKQYIDPTLIEKATTKQIDNDLTAVTDYGSYGYGYQIWMNQGGGFSFVGMGDQFAICDPKNDFIFIINSDNQGSTLSRPIFHHEVFNTIIPSLGEAIAEDDKAQNELMDYCKNLKLYALSDGKKTNCSEEINGIRYVLDKNPMEIEYIRFDINETKGTLTYKNKQGEKSIAFGMEYNEFGKFPEEGYSDDVATVYCPGNYYNCACSAIWSEERKLKIKVQIIDKYFGNGCWVFSFKDDRVMVSMTKTAEAFMNEYTGIAIGRKDK